MKIIFTAIIFCSLLSSCIKEVDLNIEQLPQKVVVNGLICPDSLFKVRVSLSTSMDSEKELINNATIKVYKDGIYSTTLASIGDGWYQGDYPNIEVNYKIEATVPGFEMVYAETSIPKYPVIIDTFFEKAHCIFVQCLSI